MNWTQPRKLLVMLLSGAWLPVTVTCRPGAIDAVVETIAAPVVVEDVVYNDGYCYDCGGGYGFDIVFDHHHGD
jgi:hypothetical protein